MLCSLDESCWLLLPGVGGKDTVCDSSSLVVMVKLLMLFTTGTTPAGRWCMDSCRTVQSAVMSIVVI